MRGRLALPVGFAIGIAGAFALAHFSSIGDRLFLDARLEWLSARAVLDGQSPYVPAADLASRFGQTGLADIAWVHPRTPGAVLLVLPFGLVAPGAIGDVAFVATIGSLILLWLWCIRSTHLRMSDAWLVLGVFVLGLPGLAALHLGQFSSVWVALGIGLTAASVGKRDRAIGGLPLGVAAVLKLWPLALVCALLVSGKRKAGAGAAAVFLALNAVGLMLPGVSVTESLAAMAGALRVRNGWVFGEVLVASSILNIAIASVAAIAYLWWVVSRSPDWRWAAMVAIPVALLSAPVAWDHYLLSLGVAWSILGLSRGLILLGAAPWFLWPLIPAEQRVLVSSVVALGVMVAALKGPDLEKRLSRETPTRRSAPHAEDEWSVLRMPTPAGELRRTSSGRGTAEPGAVVPQLRSPSRVRRMEAPLRHK